MEKRCADERWALANSTENAVDLQEVRDEEEDDDEALSLSDLPLIHQWRKKKEDEDEEEEEESSRRRREAGTQEDFDFCSLSQESEMCAADEVFFRGQILPLRHSVSSEKGLLQYYGSRNASRSITRSESMDHFCSGGLISSRSSSISSHQSSSSGSSSAATAPKYKPRLPPRNQFHSHPSPSPRTNFATNRQGATTGTNHRNCVKKSSIWNILRLGLVATPPEIAFQDLKTRCPNNNNNNNINSKNFGSRNSTSSNYSSISSSSNSNKKKKSRALLGGCKCSVDAIDTIASRVVIIKRSAGESDVELLQIQQQENVEAIKLTKKQAAKKQLSHHRTFEWLKQLSVEGTADEA